MRKHAEYKMPGGKLVVVDIAIDQGQLRDVAISGDFFLEPDTALTAINSALNGQPLTASMAELAAAVARKLPDEVRMYGIDADAIAMVVRRAMDQAEQADGAGSGMAMEE
ncbi:MAG TPA: biotin--protein ligase [Thermomonas sp.]|jgi:lipoate-protein ligase A|nr:biotin--protein ligase [Thermomonas sp.]